MKNILLIGYWACIIILVVFSYGFVDLNLHLSNNPLFLRLQAPLSYVVFHMRPLTSGIFFLILLCLFSCYFTFLRGADKLFPSWKSLLRFLLGIYVVLVLAFPALTHDLFNYITTAKVTFTHQENPYVVMPIEIPNEPYLAFTRASNKFALYGPVWIFMTAVPHILGGGNIWQTIIAFKIINAIGLLLFSFLVYRFTKSIKNTVFFALNPLVLIETLVSGHNDIFMMLFVISGLLLWRKQGVLQKLIGFILFFASWLVKGATIVLAPLLFTKKIPIERILVYAYWLMAGVFFIAGPIREELYPWYAIWIIAIASLLPYARHWKLWEFTIVLSVALELRHLPYMYMGYYGGPGPILRIVLTAVPLGAYLAWLIMTKKISLWHTKRR